MRLGDLDELKKCAIPCEIHNGALTDLCVPLYQIDNAPTVDYPFYQEAYQTGYEEGKNARTKGEWIGNAFNEHHCNKCGRPALWEEEPDDYYENLSDFCPNCGADMRGGDKE